MTSIDRTAYPRLSSQPSDVELTKAWSPTQGDVEFGKATTRGDGQLLGFVLMLKGFQHFGYFSMAEQLPETVVNHIRWGLGLPEWTKPLLPERSRYRYHAAIRKHLGVEAFGERARRFAAEVMEQAARTMDDPADLVNVGVEEQVFSTILWKLTTKEGREEKHDSGRCRPPTRTPHPYPPPCAYKHKESRSPKAPVLWLKEPE